MSRRMLKVSKKQKSESFFSASEFSCEFETRKLMRKMKERRRMVVGGLSVVAEFRNIQVGVVTRVKLRKSKRVRIKFAGIFFVENGKKRSLSPRERAT